MAERSTPPMQSETASTTPAAAKTGGTATAARPSSTPNHAVSGVQSALHFADELEYTVGQLKQELQAYIDPNVVGRDTILLRSFFDQAVGRIMRISQALKVDWSPPQVPSRGR